MFKANVTENIVGRKYGRLTVLAQLERDKHGHWHWLCQCECGKTITPSGQGLKSGNTKSCGCMKDEAIGNRSRTHGKTRSPEYRNWCAMKERCYSPKHKNYNLYGQRGIVVCDRWRNSFENFLEDMGPRPFPRATVERLNTDGNYEPGNCEWATQKEQCRNKRTNHILTIDGVSLPISQWAEKTGIDQRLIQDRITNGWSAEDAVNLPRQNRFSGPHSQGNTK